MLNKLQNENESWIARVWNLKWIGSKEFKGFTSILMDAEHANVNQMVRLAHDMFNGQSFFHQFPWSTEKWLILGLNYLN